MTTSSVWRSLVAAQFLTGPDGRPAFWKLAHIFSGILLGAVIVLLAMEHTLGATMGWIFAWETLRIFASHSVKGLQLYKDAKVAASMTGTSSLAVTGNVEAMLKEVLARRDHAAGVEPTP